jgi:hypothetical protein
MGALPISAFSHQQRNNPHLERVAQSLGRDRDRDQVAREEHPVIEELIRQLEHVKDELEHKAAHDFKGHRVAAIRHIDAALRELHTALAADKR